MRSADRPGAGDMDDEATLPWERDGLAERLLRLPPGHPSASHEPDEWWAGTPVKPGNDGRERAAADADVPEDARSEPADFDQDAADTKDDAGDGEETDPGGGGGQQARTSAHDSGRPRAGELGGGAGRDPYRPWFATGGPAEPWFALGPDE